MVNGWWIGSLEELVVVLEGVLDDWFMILEVLCIVDWEDWFLESVLVWVVIDEVVFVGFEKIL